MALRCEHGHPKGTCSKCLGVELEIREQVNLNLPPLEPDTHEHGAQKMPPRPFLKPAVEEVVASGKVAAWVEAALRPLLRGVDILTRPRAPKTKGELLRFMRIEAGYLLRDVAKLTGTSIPYIRDLEQDETELKE